MKILYLSPGVFDKGGISRYTRFQIRALRELYGSENVTVLSLLGPKGTDNDLESDFLTDWHGSMNGLLFFNILRLSIFSFLKSIKIKPDIIWSGVLNYSALIHFISNYTKSKTVIQIYGREVWTPRLLRPDINWGFDRCNYLISDCHFTADYVRKTKPKRQDIPILWDCVDLEKFYPQNPSLEILKKYGIPYNNNEFNILTLGRLSKLCEYKGYMRLLELFQKIDSRANLIFGGSGDLLGALQQKAIDLNIHSRVYFTGYIHDQDLPDIYRSASLFSLIGDRGVGRGEGIPLTPLEAAACGIPILVGNQDGSIEAIIQGENGYSLDPFDLDNIASHINLLIHDSKLRKEMGINARKRIENEHSYITFKNKLQNIIEDIIDL